MKHIAQPFSPVFKPQPRQTDIFSAERLMQAFLHTLNGKPARMLSFSGSQRIRAAAKRLSRSIAPALSFIGEAVLSALWLLFLIFGLNIFAALV